MGHARTQWGHIYMFLRFSISIIRLVNSCSASRRGHIAIVMKWMSQIPKFDYNYSCISHTFEKQLLTNSVCIWSKKSLKNFYLVLSAYALAQRWKYVVSFDVLLMYRQGFLTCSSFCWFVQFQKYWMRHHMIICVNLNLICAETLQKKIVNSQTNYNVMIAIRSDDVMDKGLLVWLPFFLWTFFYQEC